MEESNPRQDDSVGQVAFEVAVSGITYEEYASTLRALEERAPELFKRNAGLHHLGYDLDKSHLRAVPYDHPDVGPARARNGLPPLDEPPPEGFDLVNRDLVEAVASKFESPPRVLTESNEISAAQDRLVRRIRHASASERRITLGFQGGSQESGISWLPDRGVWIGVETLESRYWNAFGLGDPDDRENQTIVVEVNVALSGINRSIGGAFVKAEDGSTMLVHRGKLGGGRAGIRKDEFLEACREARMTLWVDDDGQRTEVIRVAGLDSTSFGSDIATFVKMVDEEKRRMVSQAPDREADDALHLLFKWNLDFEPKTIQLHKAVADERGSVWWGKIGEGRTSSRKISRVKRQLDEDIPTYAFLYRRGETWRTEVVDITAEASDVEDGDIPDYYSKSDCTLFVRLKDFKQVDARWPHDHLVLASKPNEPERMAGALGNQTTPLWVKIRGEGGTSGVWWVNQGKTYQEERDGGYVWAPQETKSGASLSHHTNVDRLRREDVVVHYANGAIRALGEVLQPPSEATRPDELPDELWQAPGYTAPLKYWELDNPIGLDELSNEIRVPGSGPFDRVGAVKQGYLFELEGDIADRLRGGFAGRWPPDSPWGSPAPPKLPREDLTMEWLVEHTLWPEEKLQELVDDLRTTSPQVVLAGPPGTGKTWVARHVARYLTQDEPLAMRIVQFHPSYGYEEFIEGLRPVSQDGAIVFKEKKGIVLQMAEQVEGDEQLHVLVIDEMNRANLPRVLGELMYLFEYRDEDSSIDLQYTPDFSLPSNLKFIGTMNTADRSIRSIDIALRRRFDVIECPPDAGILERFYAQGRGVNDVASLLTGFTALNERLEAELDRHHTIGQTFFMAKHMTPKRLAKVWERKLRPLIEEYFFDQPDIAAGFEAASFWSELE